ncbi:NAD(P)H-binding protein [Nocardioides sp. KIGAM211]|uniref:NAD(P)H-binding protein n=1 Tax=Nocardioides luti TaxID=2761101 RepID=A0A7X0RD02_9ACTN|nr:NAD(P)H-binding protein [Nocardioides luti]MBB6626028.1 NAD(P)H-binding protein [Nocardioides luti]
MTSIAIFGGTGYAGGHIAREAVRRGHDVTSYTRSLPTTPDAGVDTRTGSLHDADLVARVAADADVVVVATHALGGEDPDLLQALPALRDAALASGTRLSFVGGAGSSLVAPGGPRLLDGDDFHEDWKPEATAHAAVLDALRADESALDWFYVSPAALFGAWAPGEATGRYRTGGDVLVTQADGTSEISGADLAVAFVDEIEQPKHTRQRFTVGH